MPSVPTQERLIGRARRPTTRGGIAGSPRRTPAPLVVPLIVATLFVALVALLPAVAHAVPEPHQDWRTLRTDCCDIHFPKDLEAKARRVAGYADGAVAATSALLGSYPSERLQIVLSDPTDSFNGFATVLPYNLVGLYAVPPDGDAEFSRSEDWLRTVLIHEVLHIVHLDTVHGVPALVNVFLGKQWPPNYLQPRWVIEGMATYAESTRTRGGRLRSSRWDTYLRLAALEGDLWRLDDLSNGSRRPPGGGAAYLYGSHFLAFLAEQHGEDFLAGITHDYGGKAIPYQLQRSFREASGIDVEREYERFLDALRADAEAVRDDVIARGGPTKTRRLTRIGGAVRSPRFDDDGNLVFVASSPNENAGVYVISGLPEAVPTPIPLTELNTAGDVAPVAGSLVVSQTELWWNYWSYRDLFRVDPAGPPVRLTGGARLSRPARIPGTFDVVAEHRSGNAAALVRVSTKTGDVEELIRFDEGAVGYSPRVSPDGRFVAFSLLEADGARDLWELDLATRATRRLTHGPAEDVDPTYTPDGRWIVFASDRDRGASSGGAARRNGVFNLWALERETRREARVTDVLSSATQPEITPDGRAVVFVGETLAGEDLFVAPLVLPDASEPIPSDALDDTRTQETFESTTSAALDDALPDEPELDVADASAPDVSYNPLLTLWPHNWLPVVGTDPFGGPAVGIALAGQDAVERYAWAAQGTWGFVANRPRVSAGVRLLDLFFPVSLSGEWRTDASDAIRRNQGQRELHVETVLRGAISVSFPIRRYTRGHSFSLGYARELRFDETGVTAPPDGIKPVYPPSGNIGSLTLSYGYSDVERFRDSVSSEQGFAFTTGARLANALTLSELDLYELTTELRFFRRVPGLRNHAIATYLSGGIAFGERLRRANWRIGGTGDRDIVQDLIGGARFGGGYLRGYPIGSDVGDGYLLGTVEYRLPLVEIERGISTLPAYLGRVHGAVFADVGDAFDGVPDPRRLRVGVGAELRVEMLFGYYGALMLRLGYAQGLMAGGGDQPYLLVGVPY